VFFVPTGIHLSVRSPGVGAEELRIAGKPQAAHSRNGVTYNVYGDPLGMDRP